MGKCFSDAVEQALDYIYYHMEQGKGKEGLQLLEQASAAGDGDASCILARCLNGYQYVWAGHGFPEDENRATQLLHKGVEQGSALAVMICMRTGDLTPSMEEKMPYADLQEVFQAVLQKAQQGDPFCQYTVANSYFWWDFLRIQGKSAESFPSFEEFQSYLRENIRQCEDWFWKAFRGGIYFAGNNLMHYYREGDEDLILPQPEKVDDVYRIGAERGYPPYEYMYGEHLEEKGRNQEAVEWFRKAAEHGEHSAWYELGQAYRAGKGVAKDGAKAVQCFEEGLRHNPESVGCLNLLGYMSLRGEEIQKDYAKGFQLLSEANRLGNNWNLPYLAECYLYGQGTRQDYKKAMDCLNRIEDKGGDALYMLGCIYAQGLGVPADIKRGVAYLQQAGNHAQAKEELLKYKKTFFGKWVRR